MITISEPPVNAEFLEFVIKRRSANQAAPATLARSESARASALHTLSVGLVNPLNARYGSLVD